MKTPEYQMFSGAFRGYKKEHWVEERDAIRAKNNCNNYKRSFTFHIFSEEYGKSLPSRHLPTQS